MHDTEVNKLGTIFRPVPLLIVLTKPISNAVVDG
jgi:hypothetical protein